MPMTPLDPSQFPPLPPNVQQTGEMPMPPMAPQMAAPPDLGMGVLGVGPDPRLSPPPAPMLGRPPNKVADLVRLALTGLAMGMGPRTGAGTGALQGLAYADAMRQRQQAEADEQAMRQYGIARQDWQAQAQDWQQQVEQRGRLLSQTLENFRTAITTAKTKDEADRQFEFYGNALTSAGYRGHTPNDLRRKMPYAAPAAGNAAVGVLDRFMKNPMNREIVESPETLAKASVRFDRDGDGIEELVPFMELVQIAGYPIAEGPGGRLVAPPKTQTPEMKANADGILADLVAQAEAEGKTVTPAMRAEMRTAAMRQAKEATDLGPDPLLQEMREQRLADMRAPKPEKPQQELPPTTAKPGRPVLSSDANRIAEYNNSLLDVDELAKTIEGVKGATGPRAQVGAALPNAITAVTGWGRDAKQKQAVIDRVKQVIGKTLEGGVLRREDEYKYARILPTIGDDPAVVTTKLNGLRAAIERKRDETLSSLEDANYDVGKFKARTSGAATSEGWTDVGGGIRIRKK